MGKKKQIDSKMAEIDNLEGKIAEHDELLRMGRELLSQYDAIEEHGSMVDMNDFFAHISPAQKKALDFASQEQYARKEAQREAEEERERRKARIYADELSNTMQTISAKNGKNEDVTSITLSELIEHFCHFKEQKGH